MDMPIQEARTACGEKTDNPQEIKTVLVLILIVISQVTGTKAALPVVNATMLIEVRNQWKP
jgi:hypothetical protein